MPLDRDLTHNLPWGQAGVDYARSYGTAADRHGKGILRNTGLDVPDPDSFRAWKEPQNLREAINFDTGEYIDRRPQPGIMDLFSRMFGGRAGDAARSVAPRGTYYPPRGVNQIGTYADTFPEAKEVVGPHQYGDPITGTTTANELENIYQSIDRSGVFSEYGRDIGPEWAQGSTAVDSLADSLYGSVDDDDLAGGKTGLLAHLNENAKMRAIEQLFREYTQSGEFDRPDPGMVYGTNDYNLPRTMIPGYKLGQGLGMNMDWLPERDVEGNLMGMQDVMHGDIPIRQLEPIQPIGSKLMSGGDSYDRMRHELHRIGIDPTGMGNDEIKQIYDINIGGTTGGEDQFGVAELGLPQSMGWQDEMMSYDELKDAGASDEQIAEYFGLA